MKIFSRSIVLSFLSVLYFPAGAQLMRLAIMPQPTVTITKNEQPVLASLGLDYYLMEPNGAIAANQPFYNQVFSPADVVVKINNKLSHKTFQSLVEGDNALLLLQPLSKERIHAEINARNPESVGLESLELIFLSHVEIGYNKNDGNVNQALLIFKNFGLLVSSADYLNLALCMDIVQQNNKLVQNENGELTTGSVTLIKKMMKTINFNLFSPRDYKSFIESGFITITDSGAITNESIGKLQQVFYYQQAISGTRQINNNWKSKIAADIKPAFYRESYNLTKPVDNNLWKDTLINGVKYILMVAWKNKDFMSKSFVISKDGRHYFTSDSTFFKYPMFMALGGQMEHWMKTHAINKANIQEGRTRLKQLLGLTPNAGNDLFVEFWARENDFFRPAIDSSLSLTGVLTGSDSTYMQGFMSYSSNSFSAPTLCGNYPFTGYGYTWDWNPENTLHVGLNEFVVKEARQLLIRRTCTTQEYLNGIN